MYSAFCIVTGSICAIFLPELATGFGQHTISQTVVAGYLKRSAVPDALFAQKHCENPYYLQ